MDELREGRGAIGWAFALVAGAAFAGCSYATDALFGGGGADADGGALGAPASCANQRRDASETDVDCGGGLCGPCTSGKLCTKAADCASLSCAGADPVGMTCQPPSFTDGVKNGSETGLDCGGSASAPKCAPGQGCRNPTDCIDGVCKNEACTTPGATDGVKNGTETDVDCGGTPAPACENGKGCAIGTDCLSTACSPTLLLCAPVTAVDGKKNGTETDIDCGGPEAGVPRCIPDKACLVANDCNSSVCTASICRAPTGTDGVKNGDESDLDCGGLTTGAPRCSPGLACTSSADCTLGCSYQARCVDSRSCTRNRGGDTCGPGETPSAQHESCCNLGDPFTADGRTVSMERFLATAGRMRAMIEALDGNLRGWVAANRPASFSEAWLAKLPETKFDAEQAVGPYGPGERRGCSYNDAGGTSARTYDADAPILSQGRDDRAVEVPRELLDEKPLNCVTYEVAAALCAYDGREVASLGAFNAAIAGPDGRANPWGNAPAMSVDGAAALTAGLYSSYKNGGVAGTFTYRMPVAANLENTRAVPAPGRMSNSRSAWGHYDLFAPYLQWVAPGAYAETYSWEGHGRGGSAAQPYSGEAYHAIGFRCMKVL